MIGDKSAKKCHMSQKKYHARRRKRIEHDIVASSDSSMSS